MDGKIYTGINRNDEWMQFMIRSKMNEYLDGWTVHQSRFRANKTEANER